MSVDVTARGQALTRCATPTPHPPPPTHLPPSCPPTSPTHLPPSCPLPVRSSVLSLPFGLCKTGVLGGGATMLLVAWTNVVTNDILIRAFARTGRWAGISSLSSFFQRPTSAVHGASA